jgi:hypothetical protein
VQPRRAGTARQLDVEDGLALAVGDLQQLDRAPRRRVAGGGDGRDRLADEADDPVEQAGVARLGTEGVGALEVVAAGVVGRQRPEALREVGARQHGDGLGQLHGGLGADGHHLGVRLGRPRQPRVQHAWQHQVVDVAAAALDLGRGVDLGHAPPHDRAHPAAPPLEAARTAASTLA